MEKKIKEYVNYQFRFDNREDIEDLKAEIIANLIDRYYEFLEKLNNPEQAYIEAIKQMGDFTDGEGIQIPEDFSIKPSIPDILLLAGAILSIFGLILVLYHAVVGTIITAISILLFSGSAYYLYSYSQYVLKNYMDIEKHNILLKKIFKNMKTCFVFWAISLSLILAKLISASILSLTIGGSIDHNTIYILFILSFFVFILSLIILLIIFYFIYQRLINHYYYLTGDSNLKSSITDSYNFLKTKQGEKNSKLRNIIISHWFLPTISLVYLIPTALIIPNKVYLNYSSIYNITIINIITDTILSNYWYYGIFPALVLVFFITIIILRYFKKDFISDKLLIYTNYGWFITILYIIFLYKIGQTILEYYTFVYGLIFIILFTIYILVTRKIRNNK